MGSILNDPIQPVHRTASFVYRPFECALLNFEWPLGCLETPRVPLLSALLLATHKRPNLIDLDSPARQAPDHQIAIISAQATEVGQKPLDGQLAHVAHPGRRIDDETLGHEVRIGPPDRAMIKASSAWWMSTMGFRWIGRRTECPSAHHCDAYS